MYCCSLEALLSILAAGDDIEGLREIHDLRTEARRCEDGMLSVGLKIHIMPSVRSRFDPLIFDIADHQNIKHENLGNMFRSSDSWLTLVLPPVGNARAAIRLVRAIGRVVGLPIFGSKDTQIQVCTPGRLSPSMCSFLGAGFYLCSERIRSYSSKQFRTTASYDDSYRRGERLVLYDAYAHDFGEFDPDHPWWNAAGGEIVVLPRFPFPPSRTDVMVGITDPQDIIDVNMIASLLVYREYRGAWANLGSWFVDHVRETLFRHQLAGVLAAPWVTDYSAAENRTLEAVRAGDRLFAAALGELSAYALSETERCAREDAVTGMLAEMIDIMRFVRYCVETRSINLGKSRGDTE